MRVGFNARIRRGKRFPIFSKVGRNKKKNYVNLSVVRISYLRDTNKLRNCDNSVFRSERAAGCIFIDQRGRFYDMSHSFRIADAQLSLLTNVIEPCCFYVREEVQELSFFLHAPIDTNFSCPIIDDLEKEHSQLEKSFLTGGSAKRLNRLFKIILDNGTSERMREKTKEGKEERYTRDVKNENALVSSVEVTASKNASSSARRRQT